MRKRLSNAVSEVPATKTARTDHSAQARSDAATTKDAGSETDSTVALQVHELRMALLKIKAAFLPRKQHGQSRDRSDEDSVQLEAERDTLPGRTKQGNVEVVHHALRILDHLELACCSPRRHKVCGRTNEFLSVFIDIFLKR